MLYPLGPPAAFEDLRRAMVWPVPACVEADQGAWVLARIAGRIRAVIRQPVLQPISGRPGA